MCRAMERHPEVALWICVGDVASRTGAYPEPPKPLYWIKGNNEDFDRIAAWEAGRDLVPNLHFIANGTSAGGRAADGGRPGRHVRPNVVSRRRPRSCRANRAMISGDTSCATK